MNLPIIEGFSDLFALVTNKQGRQTIASQLVRFHKLLSKKMCSSWVTFNKLNELNIMTRCFIVEYSMKLIIGMQEYVKHFSKSLFYHEVWVMLGVNHIEI